MRCTFIASMPNVNLLESVGDSFGFLWFAHASHLLSIYTERVAVSPLLFRPSIHVENVPSPGSLNI